MGTGIIGVSFILNPGDIKLDSLIGWNVSHFCVNIYIHGYILVEHILNFDLTIYMGWGPLYKSEEYAPKDSSSYKEIYTFILSDDVED